MNNIQLAIAVCSWLENHGTWASSPQLLNALKIPVAQHNQARDVLKRLHQRGVLKMYGTGKFRWKLLNKDYNRENPLVTAKPEKPLKGVKNAIGNRVYFEGETYDHREQLKEKGATWDGDERKWWISPDTLAPFEDLLDNYSELAGQALPPASEPKEDVPPDLALANKLEDLEAEMARLHKKIERLSETRKVEITIKQNGKPDVKMEERTHPIFEQVMFHINCGDNIMLVGPKGCGKTYLAEQVARAMELPHGMLSLSGGVTEGKIFGRVTPNINTGKSEYNSTVFVDLFEGGGIFLLDEVDAADPNVLLSINGALANGVLSLDRAKKPLARRHKDFVCLAAANTWGHGADRQYVGRNQQDSAFTERFVQLAMDYDPVLEKTLCPGAEEMVDKLHLYRGEIYKNRLERTLSTRFIVRAFNWLQHGKDMDYIESMLFAGWRDDEIKKVKGTY